MSKLLYTILYQSVAYKNCIQVPLLQNKKKKLCTKKRVWYCERFTEQGSRKILTDVTTSMKKWKKIHRMDRYTGEQER